MFEQFKTTDNADISIESTVIKTSTATMPLNTSGAWHVANDSSTTTKPLSQTDSEYGTVNPLTTVPSSLTYDSGNSVGQSCDTSLTSTWSLCTDAKFPPNPPKEMLSIFRSLLNPDVRQYIIAFLDFYDSQNSEQSMTLPENISYLEMLSDVQTHNQELQPLSQTPTPLLPTPATLSQTPTPLLPTPATMSPTPLSAQLLQTPTLFQAPATPGMLNSRVNICSQAIPTTSTPIRNVANGLLEVEISSPPQVELRRSPRKKGNEVHQQSSDETGKVRLLASSNIKVDAKILRRATKAALGLPLEKATFKLASKILMELFTVEELAASRGQGLRLKKEADLRPVLDNNRLLVLKEYVTAWCRKNSKGDTEEKHFNDAVTEQISYARKKVKASLSATQK